jgi:hypothetical protein
VRGRALHSHPTITIYAEIYPSHYEIVNPWRISRLIEESVRPHALHPDMEATYAAMASDQWSGLWSKDRQLSLGDETTRASRLDPVHLGGILLEKFWKPGRSGGCSAFERREEIL